MSTVASDRESISRAVSPMLVVALLALILPGSLAGQEIQGRVVSDEGGLPVEGATIRLSETGASAVSGEDGSFSFLDLPPGRYRMTVSRMGFESVEREVTIYEREVAQMRIRLANEAIEAGEIAIVARRGYYDARAANAATRTRAPISETPVSLNVVTRQVLEDQGSVELEDTYRNVSGVQASGSTLNASTIVQPHIRGFITNTFFRNGQRSTINGSGAVDLVNVESIEVLKGPASILYGALEPGGVINYVTKKPQATSRIRLRQEGGSYEHLRTAVDATGPLTGSGDVLYRLNAAYTNSGSFRNVVDTERIAVAPTLTVRPASGVRLRTDVSYSYEEKPYDTGIPFGLDGEPAAPPEAFFGDPDLDPREMEALYAGYDLDVDLGGDWQVGHSFSYYRTDSSHEAIRHTGVGLAENGAPFLTRRFQAQRQNTDEIQLAAELSGQASTGPLEHGLLVGVDLRRADSEDAQFRQDLTPVPLGTDPGGFSPPDFDFPEPETGRTDWIGVFLQDQVSMLDERLHVLLSGRFDAVEQNAGGPDFAEFEGFTDEKFTGRAGALFEITDALAPYVSVSQSYRPQVPGITDAEDEPLRPEEGSQVEGGFKVEPAGGHLTVTLARYEIRKENVAVFDAETFQEEGVVAFLPEVEQRSRGIELDVAGEVAPGLSVIANYTFTDTETLASPDPAEVGRELGGVPPHAGRIWAAYDIPAASPLEGFGLGLGGTYEDGHPPSFLFGPAFELDSYVLVDAGAWYSTMLFGRPVKLQVNVDNVLDEEYYPRANDLSIVHPGEPFSVKAGVALEL